MIKDFSLFSQKKGKNKGKNQSIKFHVKNNKLIAQIIKTFSHFIWIKLEIFYFIQTTKKSDDRKQSVHKEGLLLRFKQITHLKVLQVLASNFDMKYRNLVREHTGLYTRQSSCRRKIHTELSKRSQSPTSDT